MGTNVGLSFLIGGIVGSSFKSSIAGVKDNITSLSDKIKSVAQIKLDISSLSKLSTEGKAGTAEFTALETKLKKSGINTAELSKELAKVNNRLLGLKKANVIDIKLKSNIDELKRGIGNLRGVFATAAGMGGAVYSQSDVLQAQGEIKSLGISGTGIEQITAAAKAFSNQFAGTTAPDFIRASYDIKSGISSLTDSGVAEFTRLAAMTGQATKSTTADMTKLFAMGYGIFREEFANDTEFVNQFSNAISGSVQAFRTDGPDLIQGISTLGATAKKAGVSLAEQLAIIGTSKGAFNGASNAATGYSAFLKGVGKAQTALGLQFTDSQGMMLPMVDILESIKEKYGDTLGTVAVSDEIKTAFGSDEAVKIISALIGETESLRKAENQLKKDMAEGTKTESMAKAMQMGKELLLLKQQFINFSAAIGSVLYPAFSMLAGRIGGILKGITSFIEKHKIVASVIGWVVSGIFAYVTIMKTLILVQKVWAILSLFSAKRVFLLGGGMAKLNVATRIMAVGQWLLNAAMLANPVGLVVAGIVALIGIGVALYKNWATVSAFLSGIWEKIKQSFINGTVNITKILFGIVFIWITPFRLLSGAVAYVKNHFGTIQEFFKGFWEGIKNVFISGVDFISGLLGGIIDSWMSPFKKVAGVISKVKNFLFGDEETVKVGLDIPHPSFGETSIMEAAPIQKKNIINRNEGEPNNSRSFSIDKYYGPGGMVSKANNINKGGNMTYSPQITVQGNASREDIEMAVNGGMKDFERNMFAYNEREARLSYAGD